MEVATILLWMEVATQVGEAFEKVMAIGRRIRAGENVTPEEIEEARVQAKEAMARWDAASENDKEQ